MTPTPRRRQARRQRPSNKATIRGKGDYTDADRATMKQISSAITKLDRKVPEISPSKIGRTLGNVVGMGDLGERAGKSLATLFGMGDYHVKTNSLMSVGNLNANQVPTFSKDGRRGTRITEREFLGDVTSGLLASGSSVFTNSQYTINPTNPFAFPWLSTIAQQFEQWEPHGIVFEFVSTSSEFNGTNQALGTVIMATDYDVYDARAANKLEMENYDYSNSTKPSQTAMHGIECDPSERPNRLLYCGSTPGDQRYNNLGNFQLATVGCSSANVVLGELWVSYDITFYKKQLSGSYSAGSVFRVDSQTGVTTLTSYLGAATVAANSNPNMRVEQIIGTGTRVYFPPSQYSGTYKMVWVCWDGMNGTVPNLNMTYTNCAQSPVGGLGVDGFELSSANTRIIIQNIVITNAGASILFGLATVTSLGASVYCDFIPITLDV